MTAAEVTALVNAFHLAASDNEKKSLERFPLTVSTYVCGHLAAFTPVVANTFARLRDLMGFLANDGPLFLRGAMLMAVNDVLGLTLYKIKNQSKLLTKDHTLGAQWRALGAMVPHDQQRLHTFYTAARLLNARDEETWAESIAGYFVDVDDHHQVNACGDVLDVLDKVTAQLPGGAAAVQDKEAARQRLGRLTSGQRQSPRSFLGASEREAKATRAPAKK